MAGPEVLIDTLRNRARAFIYSTALAVPLAAAALAGLDVLRAEPQRRELLQRRSRRLRRLLAVEPAEDRAAPPSAILPILVGSSAGAVELSRRLWDQGMWAPAIRPPTVPVGTAWLRISVTSLHTDTQLEALAAALERAKQAL